MLSLPDPRCPQPVLDPCHLAQSFPVSHYTFFFFSFWLLFLIETFCSPGHDGLTEASKMGCFFLDGNQNTEWYWQRGEGRRKWL